VVREVVREEVREETREEVRNGSGSEEDDGVRMVHVIDEKLDEVWRKVERTDIMVWALVQKEIGKGSQEVLERFVEGLGDEEPEDLNSFEGVDNRYVVKMRVATTPLFRIDVPSSSKSIGLGTKSTRSEANNHVEL